MFAKTYLDTKAERNLSGNKVSNPSKGSLFCKTERSECSFSSLAYFKRTDKNGVNTFSLVVLDLVFLMGSLSLSSFF